MSTRGRPRGKKSAIQSSITQSSSEQPPSYSSLTSETLKEQSTQKDNQSSSFDQSPTQSEVLITQSEVLIVQEHETKYVRYYPLLISICYVFAIISAIIIAKTIISIILPILIFSSCCYIISIASSHQKHINEAITLADTPTS